MTSEEDPPSGRATRVPRCVPGALASLRGAWLSISRQGLLTVLCLEGLSTF